MWVERDRSSRFGAIETSMERDGQLALGEGILLLALGALSLGISLFGASVAGVALPFLLLMRASDEFVGAFEGEPFGGSWHVVLAAASMLLAVVLLGDESIGPVPAAIFPGAYFLVDAGVRLLAAFRMRGRRRARWLLAAGILSLAFATLGLMPHAPSPAVGCVMIGCASLLSGAGLTGRGLVFRRQQQVALQR